MMHSSPATRLRSRVPAMQRCYITDRLAIGGEDPLLRNIRRLADTVDTIQIREKDLPTGDLLALTREVILTAHPSVRILVNERADIALACGAQGVHLPSDAISPADVRRIVPAKFLISVSCHSTDEVRRAEREGASFALLAPIFETPGKGAPLGLAALSEAVREVSMPVFALGGVTEENAAQCIEAGAAGIAAIRLFQSRSGVV